MSKVSCWADGPERIVEVEGAGPWWTRLRSVGSTCLLEDGHPGEHQWTPDDEIVVEFLEPEPSA